MFNRCTATILVILSALFVLIAAFSLQWRFAHDSPLMLYVAFLIDHYHALPYRDVFDMNLPGSYFLFYLIGHLSGYQDLGFRLADLCVLCGILVATWQLLKDFGWRVAWAAVVLFGLLYLGYGPFMSLQREYLLILPICLAVLLATRCPHWPLPLRTLCIGLLFGCCVTVKPHSIIAFPLVLWYLGKQHADAPARRTLLVRLLAPAALGFLLPVMVALVYLVHTGCLAAFRDIASGYWPLYGSLSGSHRTVAGIWRVWNLLGGFCNFGMHRALLYPALGGVLIAIYDSLLPTEKRREVWLFVGLLVCYAIYPVLSGQFWPYHWLIFGYWLTVLIAMALVDRPGTRTLAQTLIPVAVLLCAVLASLTVSDESIAQFVGAEMPRPKEGKVDAIAGYLHAHLRPGDRVQPLDWTGGAVHAMLIARAQLATPFMYDFHFYHHLSHAYTQHLRRRFLHCLADTQPRYIVEITEEKDWVNGRDTTQDFPALTRYRLEHYAIANIGEGYIIYERKDTAPQTPTFSEW